jgi:hypothetical protein
VCREEFLRIALKEQRQDRQCKKVSPSDVPHLKDSLRQDLRNLRLRLDLLLSMKQEGLPPVPIP